MPTIYLYQGQATPNDVKLSDPTQPMSTSVTGTGAVTAPAGAIAVAALETFTGTVTVTAAAGAIAAAAIETFSGTGDITAAAGAMAAAGVETVTGSGAVLAPTGAFAIAAVETFTGTGDLAAPTGGMAATGTVGSAAVTGTGDVTAAVGDLSAVGAIAVVPPIQVAMASRDADGGVLIHSTYTLDLLFPKPQIQTPPAVHGRATMTAPLGRVSSVGSVSTARLDHEEAYLLGLLDLEEAA